MPPHPRGVGTPPWGREVWETSPVREVWGVLLDGETPHTTCGSSAPGYLTLAFALRAPPGKLTVTT